MTWTSFAGAEVAALTQGTSFFADPGERECPSCGAFFVRTYVTAPANARRPTLVSYVWCSGCHKFVGTRARHPEGLIFSDPIAALSVDERRAVEGSLVGFLAYLDELWDSGKLPQSFAA
jgi:hypothetical protein